MTADQFISIAGQAATWVTALLVLLTLREMAIQRRYAYKPDLVPVDGTIHAYLQTHGTVKLPTRWTEQQLSDEEMNETKDIGYSVSFLNLGLGTAKRIKLRWEFDLTSLVKYIRNLCIQHALPMTLDQKNEMISIGFPGEQMLFTRTGLEESFGYLFPAGSGSHSERIHVPHLLVMLISIEIYLHTIILKDEERLSFFPPTETQIDYYDLENTQHTKRFEVRMQFYFITMVDREDAGTTFSARMEFYPE